ncbi:MAG: sulfotransferase [Solirubrobacteraceae bacterium]
MGAGHSGSTILGVTLGNCEKFFYAGELEEWMLRSGVPKFGGLERTRFWRSVSERVQGADDLFGADVRDALERSASVLKPRRWSTRRRLRKRYRQVSEELYRAVAGVAGATHVIDTSHFPLRARELQRVTGIDLYLVFLVRNPQGVIGSYLKPVNRHASTERLLRVITKNADLWLTHILSVSVFLRQRPDRRLFLRHEDFVADPEGVVRQILEHVESSAPLPDFGSLKTGLAIQGNPLLWSDEVTVKAKPVTPVRGSRITTLLQLPWGPVLSRMQPRCAS